LQEGLHNKEYQGKGDQEEDREDQMDQDQVNFNLRLLHHIVNNTMDHLKKIRRCWIINLLFMGTQNLNKKFKHKKIQDLSKTLVISTVLMVVMVVKTKTQISSNYPFKL